MSSPTPPVAVIRVARWVLTASDEFGRPLPQPVFQALSAPLVYTAVNYNHNGGVRNPHTGKVEKITHERKALFWMDSDGLFATPFGHVGMVRETLTGCGYDVRVQYLDPAPRRPDRFEPNWDRVLEKFQFRPKQDECLVKIASNPFGIIDATTAFGKMYLIAMACDLFPKAKIAIMTRRGEVIRKLRRVLTKSLGQVGIVGDGHNRLARVTIVSADSSHHYPADDCDILLADEVHELVTDRYVARVDQFCFARRFGFTASKETRFDNAHKRLPGMFGPTIFKLTYPEAQALGLVTPMQVWWLRPPRWPHNPVDGLSQDTAKARHGVWRHDYRNEVLGRCARELRDRGLQVLIAVKTTEHALHLRKQLPDFALAYKSMSAPDRKFFVGQGLMGPDEEPMNGKKLAALALEFEEQSVMGAIATDVWSTGVSFDALGVLVRADAQASETAAIQLPGRVCRIHEASNKECGILVDVYDEFDDSFKRRSRERFRMYKTNNWDQRLWPTGEPFAPKG